MSLKGVALSETRIPALDGLRGIAILLVIPHNGNLMLERAFHGPGYLLKEFMLNGWTGVQLFFVLSGFLITSGLLDSRDAPNYFSSFYARRALRILPLYYGMLVLTFLVLSPLHLLPEAVQKTQQHQVWLWTFLCNWTDMNHRAVEGFDHFWSLAVEEQFYLLWPLLLYPLRPPQVLRLCTALCVAAYAIRLVMRLEGGTDAVDQVYEFTCCRMDALAMGAAAAAMLRIPAWQERIRQWRRRLPWIALVLLAVGAVSTHDYGRSGFATQTYGFTILGLVFALLVLTVSAAEGTDTSRLARVLSFAPLRSVGKYSYAMYVFHYPLIKLAAFPLLGKTAHEASATFAALFAVALVVVSYLLAAASYHLYEKHFLRLKRYFVPARQPLAEAA